MKVASHRPTLRLQVMEKVRRKTPLKAQAEDLGRIKTVCLVDAVVVLPFERLDEDAFVNDS